MKEAVEKDFGHCQERVVDSLTNQTRSLTLRDTTSISEDAEVEEASTPILAKCLKVRSRSKAIKKGRVGSCGGNLPQTLSTAIRLNTMTWTMSLVSLALDQEAKEAELQAGGLVPALSEAHLPTTASEDRTPAQGISRRLLVLAGVSGVP